MSKDKPASKEVKQKLAEANMKMLLSFPFFSSLIMSMNMEESPKGTISTNGKTLWWNPDFVEKMQKPHLLGGLSQLALHLGFGHHARRGRRDVTLWNIAADVQVNHTVKESGLELPPDALMAENVGKTFGLKVPVVKDLPNMSAEKLYEVLQNTPLGQAIQDANAKAPGSSGYDPAWGGVSDATDENGNPLDENGMRLEAAEAGDKLASAAHMAKMAGKLPGHLEALVSATLKSKVDWARVMFEFVAGTRPTDYSYRKPNRRYADEAYVMPSVEKTGTGKIVAIIDTSGSVSDKELSAFLGECQHVLDMIQPEKLIVVPVDAQVHAKGIVEFECGEELTGWKAVGRGGTDMTEGFKWVRQNVPDVAKVILLSDGYTPWGDKEPGFDLLSVLSSDAVCPYGQTIKIEL